MDLKAAVGEEVMSGRGNLDGIHWNFEAHQSVAELMLKALARPACRPINLADSCMPVVVVTDSSARLPDALRRQWAIREVPLHVLLDDTDLRDGVDEIPDNIHDYGNATTAAATPAELAEVYRRALEDSGGDGVVAVHLSGALSGTVAAATTTAAGIGSSIRVVDSKSAAMNTGFVALAAARAAADGAGLDTVADAAAAAVSRNQGSSSYTNWTICDAADVSAAPAPGWAPNCHSTAAAHRRRQTRSGPTGTYCDESDRDDDRPSVRCRRRTLSFDRGAPCRQPGRGG